MTVVATTPADMAGRDMRSAHRTNAKPAAAALALLFCTPLPSPAFGGATYTPDNPTVLIQESGRRLAIEVTPDRPLYRPDALPRVTLRTSATSRARLAYRVRDGFGSVLLDGSASSKDTNALDIALPPGHGYYEIVATLSDDKGVVAERRRSIGALTPPARPTGDEPFGLWIQGAALYPELGVRWTREGIWWPAYEKQGDRYLKGRIALFGRYREGGIRVIAYPKHPHPHQTSREVIEDTPEAWRTLENWWITMVRALAGHVDAWGVVNEPMRGHWKGNDRLIVRYWALMRRIVDRYDPGTPLIGPSLNPNRAKQMAQYGDLLSMGFAGYVDAVEMHTYVDIPEKGWGVATRRIEKMTAGASGKPLPVWSSEHGYTASYRQELNQARLLLRSSVEAKRIGYPVLIWHMFGHPQGKNRRAQPRHRPRASRSGRPPPAP